MKEYPNTTTTFLIEYEGRFLLVSRGNNEENFPDTWAFPGGKVEVGETVVDTIKREVMEETGLDITDDVVVLNTYTFKQTVGLAFLVRAKHNNVRLSDELSEHEWVSTENDLKKHTCIPGIYNHLIHAREALERGQFYSLENMNLIESKYMNKD
ncbi:MAG: NUDIX domain-containing protein [Candidatus Aenigmatarchaeota archaeon]